MMNRSLYHLALLAILLALHVSAHDNVRRTATSPAQETSTVPSQAFLSSLNGPFIDAVTFTWSQYAIPLTVGTVFFTVDQINNQTNSTTIIDEEHRTLVGLNVTLGPWTRTDVNAAGTVTDQLTGLNGPTIVTYPNNFFAPISPSMTWTAILPITTTDSFVTNIGIGGTCCGARATSSPTPTFAPSTPAQLASVDASDPQGWGYVLQGAKAFYASLKTLSPADISSLWPQQPLDLPYAGCDYTACGTRTAISIFGGYIGGGLAIGVASQSLIVASTTTTLSSIDATSDLTTSHYNRLETDTATSDGNSGSQPQSQSTTQDNVSPSQVSAQPQISTTPSQVPTVPGTLPDSKSIAVQYSSSMQSNYIPISSTPQVPIVTTAQQTSASSIIALSLNIVSSIPSISPTTFMLPAITSQTSAMPQSPSSVIVDSTRPPIPSSPTTIGSGLSPVTLVSPTSSLQTTIGPSTTSMTMPSVSPPTVTFPSSPISSQGFTISSQSHSDLNTPSQSDSNLASSSNTLHQQISPPSAATSEPYTVIAGQTLRPGSGIVVDGTSITDVGGYIWMGIGGPGSAVPTSILPSTAATSTSVSTPSTSSGLGSTSTSGSSSLSVTSEAVPLATTTSGSRRLGPFAVLALTLGILLGLSIYDLA